VPSMCRKHSSNDRRSRIIRRNLSGVHQQVQKISQSESSRSVSKNEGGLKWQQAKLRNTEKNISE
jgi:hypothetical protein